MVELILQVIVVEGIEKARRELVAVVIYYLYQV
jgi:hypothetical protein